MSISAVNGVFQGSPQQNGPQGVTSIPPASTFDQELDAQAAKTGTAHGHHHGGGGSHSVTSSAATAASTAGVAPLSTVASALQHLLG